MIWAFEMSSSMPCLSKYTLPSTTPFLILSKEFHQLGIKYSNMFQGDTRIQPPEPSTMTLNNCLISLSGLHQLIYHSNEECKQQTSQ